MGRCQEGSGGVVIGRVEQSGCRPRVKRRERGGRRMGSPHHANNQAHIFSQVTNSVKERKNYKKKKISCVSVCSASQHVYINYC